MQRNGKQFLFSESDKGIRIDIRVVGRSWVLNIYFIYVVIDCINKTDGMCALNERCQVGTFEVFDSAVI